MDASVLFDVIGAVIASLGVTKSFDVVGLTSLAELGSIGLRPLISTMLTLSLSSEIDDRFNELSVLMLLLLHVICEQIRCIYNVTSQNEWILKITNYVLHILFFYGSRHLLFS